MEIKILRELTELNYGEQELENRIIVGFGGDEVAFSQKIKGRDKIMEYAKDQIQKAQEIIDAIESKEETDTNDTAEGFTFKEYCAACDVNTNIKGY